MMQQASKPVIGLCGFKGTGKDTVAGHLVQRYGFERRAFADKLKEAVANLMNIPTEFVDEYKDTDAKVVLELHNGVSKPTTLTWRGFLQRFGTEMGRNTFGQDFWVNLAMSVPFCKPTVFSDVRFMNEQRALKEIGGKIVWIERPGYVSDGHASEQRPATHMLDYILYNRGDIVDLFDHVDDMMEELYA